MQGFIYAIQSGDCGPVKIGYTLNPYQRLSQLQTGSPDKLRILPVRGGTPDDEQKIHAELKHLRIGGEWFRPTRETIAAVYPKDLWPLLDRVGVDFFPPFIETADHQGVPLSDATISEIDAAIALIEKRMEPHRDLRNRLRLLKDIRGGRHSALVGKQPDSPSFQLT